MNLVAPPAEELALCRADPLLFEQELDVRPEVAAAIERAVGRRAGRAYWRSAHDHLYALELADLGRGRPSMAIVYGFWDRFEPRPPEHEIDGDLLALAAWIAEVAPGMEASDVRRVAERAGQPRPWPAGTVLRTPEERFAGTPDFPWQPRFVEVEGLRVAYVEAGSGDPILMLHGEPTWGFLYRRMIAPLAEIGRVVVPDLVGFGRSDKPVPPNAYTYSSHVRWLRKLVEALDLRRVTLVCQDWGGLLGLRVLAAMPERFSRLVAMNTGLPDGSDPGEAFLAWRHFALSVPELDVAALMTAAVRRPLAAAEAAAYAAPFPSVEYQTAALAFPRLVPIRAAELEAYRNRAAVARLRALDLPVLLVWSDGDRVTAPWKERLRSIFRDVAPPITIEGAGHFIQEDAGPAVAQHVRRWISERR